LTRHLLLTANVGVILFLTVFVTAQLLTRTTSARDQNLQQTRLAEEFLTLPALLAEERFLDQETTRLRQRLDPLRRVLGTKRQADWPDILDTVRRAAPAGLSVVQVQSSDARMLSLTGLAPSGPAVQAFVQNLEDEGLLAAVVRVRVQRPQDTSGRLEYQIEGQLQEPSPDHCRAQESPARGGPSR
jgi:Tfp pilus assembly protein PilN